MFVKKELPDDFDWEKVSGLLFVILDTAKDGLVRRGFGEEEFLKPLYEAEKPGKGDAGRACGRQDAG